MTSSRILFPQFRDEQSASKYPFVDTATLTSTTGLLKIPADLFVDASFFGIGGAPRLYISAIEITNQSVVITAGDASSGATMSSTHDVLNPPENGVLSFFDSYGRPAGILIAEKTVNDKSPLHAFSSWAVGRHVFTAAATEFVATVSIPANEPGVRGLTTNTGELLTGDVWLIGNAGVVLRAETESIIRVDVIGVPLFKRLVCEPRTNFPTKNFLRTINNCPPDENGNFIFTGTDKSVARPVVRIYPLNGNLNFDTIGPQNT